MTKILTNSQGKPLVASGGKTFTVTAAIDSNIQAGNIKSGVEILGVTGTYGGGEPTPDPYPCVEFVDYDGTSLQKLSLQEAAALTALPAGPTHTGLTFQEWTIPLADIKAATTSLTVGPLYVTDDGKTRIYITIPSNADDNANLRTIGLRFQQPTSESITLNWGDGSSDETFIRTNNSNILYTNHVYAASGDYVITLTVSSGSISSVNQNTPLLTYDYSYSYVTKMEIGTGWSSSDSICYYMTNATSVTAPKYLFGTSIGSNTFMYCYSLSYFPLSSSITSIGYGTFRDCSKIRGIIYLPSLTSIGNGNTFRNTAFSEVVNLGTISTLNGSQSNGTFLGSKVKKVILPSTVTTVSAGAFQECSQLESITFKGSITSFGHSSFMNCSSLDFTIPTTVTSLYAQSLYGVGRIANVNLTSLSTLDSIGIFRYSGVEKITSLGSTITSLAGSNNNGTFMYCSKITSVTLPSSLTTITASAFSYSLLREITIPSSVTSIEQNAFNSCYYLSKLIMLSTTPPTLGATSALQSCNALLIFVPSASYDTYRAASNWSTYKYLMRKSGVTYDYGDTEDNSVYNNGGTLETGLAHVSVTPYIPVTGGHTVVITHCIDIYMTVVQFDSSKSKITQGSVNNGATLTLNASTAYIRFNYYTTYRDRSGVYDNTDDTLIYPYETT